MPWSPDIFLNFSCQASSKISRTRQSEPTWVGALPAPLPNVLEMSLLFFRTFSGVHAWKPLVKHCEEVGTHRTGSWVRWTLQDSRRAGWIPADTCLHWSTPRSYTQLQVFHVDRQDRKRKGDRKKKKKKWWAKQRHLAVAMTCQHLHFQTVTSFYQSLIIGLLAPDWRGTLILLHSHYPM